MNFLIDLTLSNIQKQNWNGYCHEILMLYQQK